MTEKSIIRGLESFERVAVAIAIIISPWLADLVVAGLAIRNVQQILGWPWWLAIPVGVGLEGLGMATAGVALELRSYNATRREDDPAAPVALAWALVGMQFVGSVVLAMLNTASDLVIWAIVAIPVLGGGGTLAQMLHNNHQHRLAEQEQRHNAAQHAADLAQRRAERAAARLERSEQRSEQPLPEPERSEQIELTPEHVRVRDWFAQNAGATFRTAARALEMPQTRVWNRVKELERAGVIKRNGHVEVL